MAAVLWHRPELRLALVGVLTPVAGPGSSLMSAPASVPKAAPAAVLGRIPVDMSVSGPAPAAVPATGTEAGSVSELTSVGLFPAAAPAMGAGNVPVAVPGSAVVLSALERSGSAPASAALAAPGPDAAEPGAANVSGLGLLVARAADLGSVSALVLSSGSEAGPLLVAAL